MQDKEKIYDCFTYDGEELLGLRLRLLWDVVDFFVIVEAEVTFTGLKKNLKFRPDEFEWAMSKIRYLKLGEKDFLGCKTPWDRERLQRNYLAAGLFDASPEDIVIISDVDEIVSPEHIPIFISSNEYVTFELLMLYFYCNYLCITEPLWHHAIAVRADFAMKFSFEDIRSRNPNIFLGFKEKIINICGWHFSYLGGIDKINEKLDRFSHQEFNTKKYKNKKSQIEKIFKGQDIYNRPLKWGVVSGFDLRSIKIKEYFQERPFLIAPENIKKNHEILEVISNFKNKSYLQKLIKKIQMKVWMHF